MNRGEVVPESARRAAVRSAPGFPPCRAGVGLSDVRYRDDQSALFGNAALPDKISEFGANTHQTCFLGRQREGFNNARIRCRCRRFDRGGG